MAMSLGGGGGCGAAYPQGRYSQCCVVYVKTTATFVIVDIATSAQGNAAIDQTVKSTTISSEASRVRLSSAVTTAIDCVQLVVHALRTVYMQRS